MKDTRVTKACTVCGTLYKVKAYTAATSKFCSKACWSHRNPPTPRLCANCGKEFNSRDKRATYCSRSCASSHRTGARAGAWKGGVSLHRVRAQASGQLARWRKEVFQRDNYTCQHCGATGYLHAHHIKEFSNSPEHRFDVSNGLTVCVPCHEKIHGRKISSPGKFPKHCIDCGAPTAGRSMRCRSCSSISAHARLGHSINSAVKPISDSR